MSEKQLPLLQDPDGLESQRGQTKRNDNRFLTIFKHSLVILACLIVLKDGFRSGLGEWLMKKSKNHHHHHHRHGHHRSPIPNPSDPFSLLPCNLSSPSSPFLCGHLTVPLDYTNTSDLRTVKLAITVYKPELDESRFVDGISVIRKAGKEEKRKTMFVNPGGPGGSGTNLVWRRGEFFSWNLTGGEYDVLGWDPRGVNQSTPSISCFPTNAHRDRWFRLSSEYAESGGTAAIRMVDSYNEALMKGCRETMGDLPRFMTTAFVARDMEEIRKALKVEVVDMMGISYGTGISQTYQQMFPDRVGRMVMDGMEYAPDGRQPWAWGTTSLDNVTALFEDGFVGECVAAGPERCALAPTDSVSQGSQSGNATAIVIERIKNLFSQMKEAPIPGYLAKSGPGIITYGHMMQILYQSLYRPESWPKIAQTFADLMNGNTTLAMTAIDASFGYDPDANDTAPAGTEFAHGWMTSKTSSQELGPIVICGDSYDAEKHDLDWWIDLRKGMVEKSFISGNSRFYNGLECRNFDWEVAEVYRGDFRHKLKNPVLVIGQTYDPATPLRNGRRLANEMGPENARLIVHHGYGHSSRAQPSTCVDRIVSAYFMNGTLPDEFETECWADERPYPEVKAGAKEYEVEDLFVAGF